MAIHCKEMKICVILRNYWYWCWWDRVHTAWTCVGFIQDKPAHRV